MKTVFLEMERLRNLASGLGQFCRSLGETMLRMASPDLDLTFYVPPPCRGIFGGEERYVLCSPAHALLGPPRRRYACWHCLHQDSRYLPVDTKTPLVLTIHDINFATKYTGLRKKLKHDSLQKKIDRASLLAFPTRFTEETVRDRFRLNGKQTAIIPYGNCLNPEVTAGPPFPAPPKKFLFTIGIVSPKKNFHVLVPFLRKLDGYALVIAGDDSTGYAKKIRDEAHYHGIADRVHLIGVIDDRAKSWWYRNCEAFVFPSLAEGFGLPVVEAMSLGKPVFLSTSTSLPEVGGAEAFYWPEFDPDVMARVFEAGMLEYAREAKKAERIRDWARTFSWETTARRYLAIYSDLSA